MYWNPFSSAKLGVPTVSVKNFVQLSRNVVSFVASVDKPAPFLLFSTPYAGKFDDNGFTLLNGAGNDKCVVFTASADLEVNKFAQTMTWRTIRNTYK